MEQDIFNTLKGEKSTLYLAAAGGGSSFLSRLTSREGRSSIILGTTFLNSQELFDDFVGSKDEKRKYCSEDAAFLLAQKSFFLGGCKKGHIGVGISASLFTENQREGRVNKVHVCLKGYEYEFSGCLILDNSTPRESQELEVSDYTLKLLRHFVEQDELTVFYIMDWGNTSPRENQKEFIKTNLVKNIFLEDAFKGANSIAVYPGSFNPIHEDHLGIINVSRQVLDKIAPLALEISLKNFHGKVCTVEDVNNRVEQIQKKCPIDVVHSYCSTFKEKRLALWDIEAVYFVCGSDVWNRISESDLDWFQDMEDTERKVTKFLVFGRGIEFEYGGEHNWVKPSSLLIYDERIKNYKNRGLSSTAIRNSLTKQENQIG